MDQRLLMEVNKFDMKFSPGNPKPRVDFIVRYSSPRALDIDEEGIAVSINRKQPDRTGKVGLARLDVIFPLSFQGLEEARRVGIYTVKDLYGLPENIPVIEPRDFPRAFPNRNFNAIYRCDLVSLLALNS